MTNSNYNIALAYLRACVILLVVLFHASIAYFPDAPPPPESFETGKFWRFRPVVDSQGWILAPLIVSFLDVFFMTLLFFVSGMFVWKSLKSKGSYHYMRDRLLRIGLPLLVFATILPLFAYYPTFLQMGAPGGVKGFLAQWWALHGKPIGPLWFLGVLLFYDIVVTLLYLVFPTWGDTLGKLASGALEKPFNFFLIVLFFSAVGYLSMLLFFDALQWTSIGPFRIQISRILHYFVWFMAGAAIGAWGLDRGLVAANGNLAKRWYLWVLGALVAFALFYFVLNASPPMVKGLSFVISCTTSCFALTALFVHFTKSHVKTFDSLSDNAYGIYLVHYAFITWLQYALLQAPLSGFVKVILVVLGTLLLSWSFVALLRRIPGVARVI